MLEVVLVRGVEEVGLEEKSFFVVEKYGFFRVLFVDFFLWCCGFL